MEPDTSKRRAGEPAGGADIPASQQEYLAVELGHAVDRAGEPSGLNIPNLQTDRDFQDFTLSLWRQVQSNRSVSAQLKEMDREGLSAADLWGPGISEFLPTSSTADEIRRYTQKLLFRANVLEAILTETVSELKALSRVKPADADPKSG